MLSAALAADRARVADIDARILDLERAISVLRIERAPLQARLDSYKYPVLTLPNEIASEIFVQFLPVYPLCPPSTGILSPTLLTRICRRWREIALATPSLWRAITLSYYDIAPERQARICDITSRSGCFPLSIQLNQYETGYEFAAEDPGHAAEVLLATVVPHCARWEHLTLRLFNHLPTIDGPMPLLRHLDLSLGEEPSDAPVYEVFRELPQLRTAVLDDIANSAVILPWAQLTSLTLLRVQQSECVSILQQTSELVHCVLQICFFDFSEERAITLPRLESLTLKGPTGDLTMGYLHSFIVPALRRLQTAEIFLRPAPIDSLRSFTVALCMGET